THPAGIEWRQPPAEDRRRRGKYPGGPVQGQAKLQRITARGVRQLIDERLEGKAQTIVERIAPRAGRQTQLDQRLTILQVGYESGGKVVRRQFGTPRSLAMLTEGHEMISECNHPALRIQRSL